MQRLLAAVIAAALAAPQPVAAANLAAAARAGSGVKIGAPGQVGASWAGAAPIQLAALPVAMSLNAQAPSSAAMPSAAAAPQFARSALLHGRREAVPSARVYAPAPAVPAENIRFKAAEWTSPQPGYLIEEAPSSRRRDAAPSARTQLRDSSARFEKAAAAGAIAAISSGREVFDQARRVEGGAAVAAEAPGMQSAGRSGLRRAPLKSAVAAASLPAAAAPAAAAESSAAGAAAAAATTIWVNPLWAVAAPIAYALFNPLRTDFGKVETEGGVVARVEEGITAGVYGTTAFAITTWIGFFAIKFLAASSPAAVAVLLPATAYLALATMRDVVGQARRVRTGGWQASHDIDRLVGVGDNKRARASKDALNWSYGSGYDARTGARGDRYDNYQKGLIGRAADAAMRVAAALGLIGGAALLSLPAPWVWAAAAALTLLYFLEDVRRKMRGPPTAPTASSGVDY